MEKARLSARDWLGIYLHSRTQADGSRGDGSPAKMIQSPSNSWDGWACAHWHISRGLSETRLVSESMQC